VPPPRASAKSSSSSPASWASLADSGGCLIGYLIASYVNSLAIAISSGPSFSVILTFIVDPWDILAFPLITLLLSVVAGVYPAHQASKLDPVIALRG